MTRISTEFIYHSDRRDFYIQSKKAYKIFLWLFFDFFPDTIDLIPGADPVSSIKAQKLLYFFHSKLRFMERGLHGRRGFSRTNIWNQNGRS